MVGDYMVQLGAEGNLSSDQISKITNAAKLAVGSVAMLAGVDVDIAANSAGIAVENDSFYDKPMGSLDEKDDSIKFKIVFKINDKGHNIICFGNAMECLPRANERYATNTEVKSGMQNFAMSIVPIPGGVGVKLIVKESKEVVGIYKNAKLAQNAVNSATKQLLVRQLKAEQIANGHAFEKHVIQQGQFPFIKTKQQFADHIEEVMTNPTHYRQLGAGREAFYDAKTSTFIVKNPKDPDGGTAFKETLKYFNAQN